MTKRGRSHYVESWNPSAKRFIVTCSLCGSVGYSPTIDGEGFCDTPEHKVIRSELKATLKPLALDELGRCEVCARNMDKK